METIKELYKVGPGPSSSHTIGPYRAALDFKSILEYKNIKFDKIIVTLYGSLALTGKGHLSDFIIKQALNQYNVSINFSKKLNNLEHPNTMDFEALYNNQVLIKQRYYSIGGGNIATSLKERNEKKNVYNFSSFNEIKKYMEENNINNLVDFCNLFEEKDIDAYLENIIKIMFERVESGLNKDGYIKGKLHLKRVAKNLAENLELIADSDERRIMEITCYAYAVSEENADGEIVVTAPTCGSCGVVPAILYYLYKHENASINRLVDSLKVAGIFGNLIKENASISGAVLGCQAEVGTASVMASAALAYYRGLSTYQIEYGAEIAMEHFLGLTCDPVGGYVQIPCIERNGIGALRAYASVLYAKYISKCHHNRVSFDEVVETMKQTGEDLSTSYKETGLGGLANVLQKDI